MKNRMTSFGIRHSVSAFVAALAFFPECHLAEDGTPIGGILVRPREWSEMHPR